MQQRIRRHVRFRCVEGCRHDDIVLNWPVASRERIVQRGGYPQHEAVAERGVVVQTEHRAARQKPATPNRSVDREEQIDAAAPEVVIGPDARAEVGDLEQGASAGLRFTPSGADVSLEPKFDQLRDGVHRGAVTAAPRPDHEIFGGPTEIRTAAQTELPVPQQRLTERSGPPADFGSSDGLRARPRRRPGAEQHCGDANPDRASSHTRPFPRLNLM